MSEAGPSYDDILEKTERLPPERLANVQRQALVRMLKHAYAETAFYRERLAPLFAGGDEPDLSRLTDVPITTRTDCLERGAEMWPTELPERASEYREVTTSGTTQRPLPMRYSLINSTIAAALAHRRRRWHGLDFDARLAQIIPLKEDVGMPPEGRRKESWNPSGTGDLMQLNLAGTDVEQQLEWLVRQDARYLATFPSAALALLQMADERGVRLPLQHLLTAGETIPGDLVPPNAPDHWPKVLDSYVSSEVGTISGVCTHGRYHVHVDAVFLELLGDDGRSVAPGQVGRVVATSLFNFAMPFIRYDLGDRAMRDDGEPCGCGLSLPTMGPIMGRQYDAFHIRDRTVWPILYSMQLRDFVGHSYWQLAQTGPEEVTFRYTPKSADQEEDRDGLVAHIRKRIDPDVSVAIERVAPPGPATLKQRSYVNEASTRP